MRLKTYKIAMSTLPKFLTLKWNISITIWRIEVGDGSFCCIFQALSFELNFFYDRRFPLINGVGIIPAYVPLIIESDDMEPTKYYSLSAAARGYGLLKQTMVYAYRKGVRE